MRLSLLIAQCANQLAEHGDAEIDLSPETYKPFAVSERICLLELAREVDQAKTLSKAYDAFVATLPKDKQFTILWRNRVNADHHSKEYNPMGTWGAFEAVEVKDAKATAMESFIKYYKNSRSMV
jgi:hypothetical protein